MSIDLVPGKQKCYIYEEDFNKLAVETSNKLRDDSTAIAELITTLFVATAVARMVGIGSGIAVGVAGIVMGAAKEKIRSVNLQKHCDNIPFSGFRIVKKGEDLHMLKKVEEFAKGDKEVLKYIQDILNNDRFKSNPKRYLDEWKIKRGTTEEFRWPEDEARMFFDQNFKS